VGAGRCRRSSAVSGGELRLRAVNLASISLGVWLVCLFTFRFATVREGGGEKSDEKGEQDEPVATDLGLRDVWALSKDGTSPFVWILVWINLGPGAKPPVVAAS
jgi:hypothetical protein